MHSSALYIVPSALPLEEQAVNLTREPSYTYIEQLFKVATTGLLFAGVEDGFAAFLQVLSLYKVIVTAKAILRRLNAMALNAKTFILERLSTQRT